MEHVDIVLASTVGPFSTAIKAVTWSQWSHTAMVMPEGQIIEATLSGGGVHYSTLISLLERSDKWAIVRVPVKDQAEVFFRMDGLVGKPYDLIGALALGLHRDLSEDDKFWCSEANYFAIHEAGNKIFRMECMNRITPEHFWQQNFEIVGSMGL